MLLGMGNPRVDWVLAAARMLKGLHAMGADVETSDFNGKPAIEHLVGAYDALSEEDWPQEQDATWRVLKASGLVAGMFHLGASVEASEANGRNVMDILCDEVENLDGPAISFD
jgi:hypothetical protein